MHSVVKSHYYSLNLFGITHHHFIITPGGGLANPAQGQLIHMAVPLSKPRQEHIGRPPSALVTSTPQATSTPLLQTPQNQRVTFLDIRDQELDEEQPQHRDATKKSPKPNLTKHVSLIVFATTYLFICCYLFIGLCHFCLFSGHCVVIIGTWWNG